ALGLEQRLVFLADRFAELVGLARRIPGHRARREHDLLLVDEDAVGVLEDRLELGQRVGELRAPAPLDVDLDRSGVERARTVEGVERGEIVEYLGIHAAEEVAHAGRLELKDSVRPPVREEPVHLGVVERDCLQARALPLFLLHEAQGVVEDRQRDEPEEVHLEKTHPVDRLHFELRRDLVVAVAIERQVLDEGLRRDEDARRVDARVARHALEPLAQIEKAPVRLVVAERVRQLLHVAPRLGEHRGLAGIRRNERAEAVNLGERNVQDAAHVAKDGPRLHGVERDDLADVLAPVLRSHVLDDLAAAALAQVDVDVGHRDAVGIQEALEEKVVAERIDIRDPERPRDERARRAPAPRSHGNALVLRVLDEVPHDEEVAREAHLPNDGELPGQALVVVLPGMPDPSLFEEAREKLESALEALFREVFEIHLGRPVAGDGEPGNLESRVHDDARRDALGDRGRVLHRLERERAEHVAHLLGVLHVELRVVELHALRVVERLPHPDTQEDVLGCGVVARQVVRVVRGDGRNAGLRREPQKAGQDLLLLREAVIHELDEVTVLPEYVAIFQGRLLRAVVVAHPEPLRDLRIQAARERDDPLVILLEKLPVHARLVIEAGQERLGHEPRQVPVAVRRLDEERQVVVVPLAVERLHVLAIEARPGRDIRLDAEDRLDARLERGRLKLVRPEHVPVVGDRHGIHPGRLHLLDQVLEPVRAVEKGVLRVQVKVDEVSGHPARDCSALLPGNNPGLAGRRAPLLPVGCGDLIGPMSRTKSWRGARIYTVGHSTRTLDELVALLRAFDVSVLADIRTIPRSRHNPQFNGDALRSALRSRRLRYVPLPELGGLRRPRKDSSNTGWRNASFRGFADYMLTEDFETGLAKLHALTAEGSVALMCAET